MSDQAQFLPASSFTLEAFAAIFTRSFEGYAYASQIGAEEMARRVRVDTLDLYRSPVLLIGGQPAGMAVLGLRGERAWCGGFGIMPAYRGRGLSHLLIAELLDQAQRAGARGFSLEVLTRNQPAINTYTRAGMRARRDLLVFEWRRPQPPPPAAPTSIVLSEPPEQLLGQFAALHPLPAAWQRDLPALLVSGGLHGLALRERGDLSGYLLFQIGQSGVARISDLGARRAADVAALLHALQLRSTQIFSVNEPAESPFVAAYRAAGFVETERQHEMVIDLG